MAPTQVKYNPGILSDDELINAFVVRQHYLELILETIRENTGSANQHILVVGPRGSGKTMLVRRIAAEIHTQQELDKQFYPLVFAEESYQVFNAGEFWLEALFHLADQTQVSRWRQAYEELRDEPDTARLRDRALAQLMDFADEQSKRLVLIVENLNMLISEQLEQHADWELRHTLLNEPRLMLLGTATVHFDEIKNIDKAWFELFSLYDLKPLDTQECKVLWHSVNGDGLSQGAIRPIQILTGGNPRLIAILARFAVNKSLRELLEHLVKLIDDHTDYFKSQLESLASTERKVFVALLDIWDPVGAREVARFARMDVSKTSVLLNRLISRGAVQIWEKQGRRKLYQVTERLYNIYYLMRRRSHPSNRVRAVVDFMVSFYEGKKLAEAVSVLAMEACQLQPKSRQEHFLVYEGILKRITDPVLKSRILRETPEDFFQAQDIPVSLQPYLQLKQRDTLKGSENKDVAYWFRRGVDLEKEGRFEEAKGAYQKSIEIEPDNGEIWLELARLLHQELESYDEAEQAYRHAIELNPDDGGVWGVLGLLLHYELKRYDEAEQAYRHAIELNPDTTRHIWGLLGLLLHYELKRYDEAEQAYRKVIELEPEDADAWMYLGLLFHYELERYAEAEQAYLGSIELRTDDALTWASLGELLHFELERYDEAEQAYYKVLELEPSLASIWVNLAELFIDQGITPQEIVKQAIDSLEDVEATSSFLNAVAWHIYEKNLKKYLPQAEKWALEAVEKNSDNSEAVHTLATILGAQGKWDEALKQAEPLLLAAASQSHLIQDSTELVVAASAAGHAEQALETIIQSQGAPAFEPLIVGIRIFLGETPQVAQEIFEVGQDVAQRIREQQAEVQNQNPNE